jgi:hypothetical protein
MKKIFFLFLFPVLIVAQIKITKNDSLVIAETKDLDGNGYVIGLGKENAGKSETELTLIAQQRFKAIKESELIPVVKNKGILIREAILKELGTPEQQLELIYNDMVNGTKVWIERRTEIISRFK